MFERACLRFLSLDVATAASRFRIRIWGFSPFIAQRCYVAQPLVFANRACAEKDLDLNTALLLYMQLDINSLLHQS